MYKEKGKANICYKSFLIKKTFVTAISKTLLLYDSFSYFSGKTTAKVLKLLDASNFLKFLVEKRLLKDNLKFQLAHVDSTSVNMSDQKVHDFSIMWLGKRKKKNLLEPIETVIDRAQQNFEVVGGLNPV